MITRHHAERTGTMSKKKYHPKAFESLGDKYTDADGHKRTDTSANLYESMLTSDAWKDLPFRQRALYTACKAQYYGKRKPEKDFPEVPGVQGDDCFYMNAAAVKKYGIYTKNMHREFYGDLKALCGHGFITCVSNGQANKSRSIYRFSSSWAAWKP